MKYRPEIDGLRALAVLTVILFHAGAENFTGGYVGVDVFFVISGYLITSLLISDLKSDNFSLIGFYERRARRILPALFFVMFCCLPFAYYWLDPIEFRQFIDSGQSVALFFSNIFFFFKSGYFDYYAELNPLLHTWSLAVEEQWYILFPALLFLGWKMSKRNLFATLTLIFFVSLGLSLWTLTFNPTINFYFLHTRIWELLIGVFCAFYITKINFEHRPKWLFEIAGVLGLSLLCYSIITFDKSTPVPSLYTLFPTIGAALIILFTNTETEVGKFLGNRLFVGLGLISYSAYLWHQPLIAFVRLSGLGLPGDNMMLAMVPASIVLAAFSWRMIEVPFRNRNWIQRKTIFKMALFGSTFYIALAIIADSADIKSIARFLQKKDDGIYQFDLPKLQKQAGILKDKYDKPDLEGSFETQKKKVLVIGDSMADDFITAAKLSSQVTSQFELKHLNHDDLCFEPTYDSIDCALWRRKFSESLLPAQSDVIIIVVGFQPDTNLEYFITNNSQFKRKFVIVSSSHFLPLSNLAEYLGTINKTEYDRLGKLFARAKHGPTAYGNSRAEAIAHHFEVPYYDGYKLYCLESNFCPLINLNGELLIFDTAHRTEEGLKYFSTRVEKWFLTNFNYIY